jgi:hypothetical protein
MHFNSPSAPALPLLLVFCVFPIVIYQSILPSLGVCAGAE